MSRFCQSVLAAFVLLALLPAEANAQPFETKAKQAYMIDAETGTVLLSKNPDTPFPPASIAKLMTMEVVFEALKSGRLSLDDGFYVSEHAWRTGGAVSGTATMFAEVTSTVPLEALIRGAVIQSANDACIAIAEGMAGAEESFAGLMTQRARRLDLEKSTFVNATGLPAEGQQVTAREMTSLAQHIWREYPEYYGYFSEPDFEWNGIRQRNRNPLLPMEIGADGLKTGYTEESGYAIVASIARQGRRLFLTLGGLESERERAEEARKVLDWGMRGFEMRTLFAEGEVIGAASVYGGAKSSVALRPAKPVAILVPLTEPERLSARIVYEGPVPAPVEEGAEIGTLQIWLGDTLSREAPVYAGEPVARGTLHQRALDAVGELLIGWMR
ncbi:D-alanyl-D-alanine carboxypeptidase family protein [Chelativorans sp. M5D2P16]|uniref:D-alanyl-D-alanine carboxypeptidase family protein n=1 Tax=Chelativorans sp. M5D2P16 TaxID=3095678 RepID=UPI002ACAD41A|nr:D-alanyl-D-alanine carboxypeptidase family protein [Chelativorans sp. M5D2P16]MDZ5697714.1 D-alanyl-D-alanine carboxypeptidase family protein [Chelativorans sp. M5D2P16]